MTPRGGRSTFPRPPSRLRRPAAEHARLPGRRRSPPARPPLARSNLISTSKRSNGITQVTYTGHPLHCFADDTTAGDTNGEETSASGATVVRRKRIRQQGRTRLMGD
ncbi:hypothetical protein ACH40F_05355 [Streptomyces sp. NPDC020794]|uniref:hypothetical protein n=1 Tax=unclassified Streptomyces TaxID=2593676 RepID=UPI0036EC7508